jgi:hypothetical protein
VRYQRLKLVGLRPLLQLQAVEVNVQDGQLVRAMPLNDRLGDWVVGHSQRCSQRFQGRGPRYRPAVRSRLMHAAENDGEFILRSRCGGWCICERLFGGLQSPLNGGSDLFAGYAHPPGKLQPLLGMLSVKRSGFNDDAVPTGLDINSSCTRTRSGNDLDGCFQGVHCLGHGYRLGQTPPPRVLIRESCERA